MLKELVVKIGADTTEFVRKIGQVSAETANVSESFRAFGQRTQTIFQNLGASLQRNGEAMKEFGANATTFLSLPMAIGAGASIKLASDMQESLNKVNVSFGTSSEAVKAWAENSVESMGLASGTALDASALFGDMATSMGIGQAQASQMSMSLVQLGADLASFKNIPVEQAMQALNGVFTGETESLKMLGVVMTQTQLQAFALAQGIQKPIDKMTEAEMVTLRYQFVLDRTKNAQGDFARTSEGSANQMRMFTENLKNIGAEIGNILLPAFTAFIQKINDLLKGFTNLSDDMKLFIVILGGVAIALPPIIFGLGAIGTSLPILASGFRILGTAMKFALLNPIGLIITALVSFGYYIYQTQGSIENVGRYIEQLGLLWQTYWTETKLNIMNAFFAIKTYAKETELSLVSSLSSFLQFFGFTIDSIQNEVKRLQGEVDTLNMEQLDYSIKANGELAKQWAQIYKLDVAKAISLAQEAMANADYWMESIAIQAGNAGRVAIEARTAVKTVTETEDQLDKKREEAKKKADQLKKANLDLASTLQNNVVTALKNKNKALDESIKKLQDSIQKEKSALDQIKKQNLETYEQIAEATKRSYDQAVYDLEESYKKQLDADKEITDQKMSEVERRRDQLAQVLKQEENLVKDQAYEQKKQSILNEMFAYKNLKTREEVVNALAELVVQREKELNAEGNSIRLDSLNELTQEENAVIRNKLNDFRRLEVDSYNKSIEALKVNAQKQIDNRKTQYEHDLLLLKNANGMKMEEERNAYLKSNQLAEEYSNNKIKIYEREIGEQKLLLLDLSTEEKAQLEAKRKILTEDHEEVKKLLRDFAPDYFIAGRNFGNELLMGIESQKKNIQSVIGSIASPIKTESTKDIQNYGTKLGDTIKDSIGGVIDSLNAKLPTNPNYPTLASNQPKMPIAENYPMVSIPTNEYNRVNWMDMTNATRTEAPRVYLDGKEISKAVMPYSVDVIRAKTGLLY